MTEDLLENLSLPSTRRKAVDEMAAYYKTGNNYYQKQFGTTYDECPSVLVIQVGTVDLLDG